MIAFPNRSPAYIVAHPELYQKYGLLRWEDGQDHALPQDFADMRGWRELAAKVDAAYAALPNTDQTLVLCDNYGQAGAINYYSEKGIQAVSFNADYVNWFDLEHPIREPDTGEVQRGTRRRVRQNEPLFRGLEHLRLHHRPLCPRKGHHDLCVPGGQGKCEREPKDRRRDRSGTEPTLNHGLSRCAFAKKKL